MFQPWFWQRDDLYRWNGKCCYYKMCDGYNGQCNPEECEQWDHYFDGECLAEESHSELD